MRVPHAEGQSAYDAMPSSHHLGQHLLVITYPTLQRSFADPGFGNILGNRHPNLDKILDETASAARFDNKSPFAALCRRLALSIRVVAASLRVSGVALGLDVPLS